MSPAGDNIYGVEDTEMDPGGTIQWPLLSSSRHKFYDRELARNSGVFFTQNNVADVFHPVVRGSATLVTADE